MKIESMSSARGSSVMSGNQRGGDVSGGGAVVCSAILASFVRVWLSASRSDSNGQYM